MRTTLALVFLAVLVGQAAAGVEIGSSRKLLQENRIGTGAGNILDAVGADQEGADVTNVSDADDGDLTNDLANTGQQIGQLELDTFPAAGNSVPGRRRLLQPGPGGPGGKGPGSAGPGGAGPGGKGGNAGGANNGGASGNGDSGTGIVTTDANDVTTDITQDENESKQLAGDTTSNLGLGNPAGGVNTPGVNTPGVNTGTGNSGVGQIVGADSGDATGDVTQLENEGSQLAGDTVSNTTPAAGRKLLKKQA